MIRETVYLGHDNTLDWRLTEAGVAIDMSNATNVTLTVGGVTFDSDDYGGGATATNPFFWVSGTPADGEANIFLRLGNIFQDAGIVAGTYRNCRFTVYDAINTNGILWDNTISFVVK